ncbi:hypothetical protein MHK_010063, partial [Candidatus Magnetomorum sp. HK-1]
MGKFFSEITLTVVTFSSNDQRCYLEKLDAGASNLHSHAKRAERGPNNLIFYDSISITHLSRSVISTQAGSLKKLLPSLS